MAIGDILEGLLAGAAGGFRGYSEMSRLQREEEERERVRREAAAEREAERAYRRQRDEQQDALASALQDVQMAEMGYRVAPEMAATGATFAPEAPELMSVLEDLRPTAMDIPAPARPETRDGRIRGTDVGVAPGQTYSAVQKALMDAEKERPEPQPDTRVVMERGPRPIEARLPSAEERGAQVLRFPGDRTYVRERQLTPAEQREVDLESRIGELRAIAKEQARIDREQRTLTADELGLTGDERREYIATGDYSRFAPRPDTMVSDWADDIAMFARTVNPVLNRLPTEAEIDVYATTMAQARGIPQEVLQRLIRPSAPSSETPTTTPDAGGVTPRTLAMSPELQAPTRIPQLVEVSDFNILKGRTAEEIARAEIQNLRKQLEGGGLTETERVRAANRLIELERSYGF